MRSKIKIVPLLIFYTKLGAILGLILGVIYSFGGLVVDCLISLGWMTSFETSGLSMGTLLAFGALIGMPLIFGVFGFLVGGLRSILVFMCTK